MSSRQSVGGRKVAKGEYIETVSNSVFILSFSQLLVFKKFWPFV
jgi:hypothetical protein